MANFHENNLVITANEEDMKKVLARIAMNLAANEEYTGFNIDDIAGYNTAKELYRVVAPAVDAYYIFAFSGAPVPDEDVDANVTPGWTSPTSSEAGFLDQLQAMMRATEQFNANAPEGVSIALTSTAPVGRPMSDTADISLKRYGENWVLTIDYATAWAPNSDDIDDFFMGLPAGSYGVAFYDADEYDSYQSISIFSGLHHGCAPMFDTDFECECECDTIEESDLEKRKREYAGVSRAAVADLTELAKITATCGWTQFSWDDFEGDGYDDYDDEFDDDCDEDANGGIGWSCKIVNWSNPRESDLKEIDELILSAISSFPWCCQLCGVVALQSNEAVDRLFPGDVVKVVSDWSIPEHPDQVYFDVFDSQGTQLGIISNSIRLFEGWQYDQSSSAALACLLPHLTATVNELVPASLRSKGVESPDLSIRFDLELVDFEELLTQTHTLLEKIPKERTLSSKGKE